MIKDRLKVVFELDSFEQRHKAGMVYIDHTSARLADQMVVALIQYEFVAGAAVAQVGLAD
jgi:hypothetical protein